MKCIAILIGCIVKLRIIVHEDETGGYWAEVLDLPGCMTQGETLDELMANVREAIEGCLWALKNSVCIRIT
jgi:predicted RNase H-like HicB family nuclease